PGQRIIRHDAETDFIRHENESAFETGQHHAETVDLLANIPLPQHEVAEPQSDAVDKHELAFAAPALQGACQFDGLFHRPPLHAALPSVIGNALLHFLISRLRRGDIDALTLMPEGEFLGVAALAGPGAANDEDAAAHGLSGGKRAMNLPRMAAGHWRKATAPISLP